jgi:FAD/FMN-containing dehydrogenase
MRDSKASVHDLAARHQACAVQIRPDTHAPASEVPFAPEHRVRAELTRRVKAAFDPLRLFNPGRMWEGV